MMCADSTGGTSRGSGKPPVFDFRSFLSWLCERGFSTASIDVPRHLFYAYGFQRLVPYFDFIGNSRGASEPCSLEAIQDLVRFDEELRVLLVRWIGVVEMQVRSQYSQAMLDECGPNCLYDPSCFRNERERASVLHLVEADLKKHGRNNAGVRRAQSAGDDCVPVWTAIDAVTFGTLRRLYDNTAVPEVTNRVTASFGVNKKCLRSWLRTLVLVRNCCAHFNPYVVRSQIPGVPKPVFALDGDVGNSVASCGKAGRGQGGCKNGIGTGGSGCGSDAGGGNGGNGSRGTGGTDGNGSRGGTGGNASPLYVLAVLDRLLQGRARAGTEFEREDWHSFRRDAKRLVGGFTRRRPELAQALRIPSGFADKSSASCHPVIRFEKGPCREMLWSVSLAA